ncbi:YxeA family protein [Lactobacillus sp. PV037]|uniref:YxeA family protein n=1 Tax=Lactobacillus sp. PV037 TaxID=2594496 RepID=UPI002240BE29|nr:YxeA family protein [Lactobacillus sp. PV037]QNQ84339.1 YxeA family protein [Lactobacillus sp. PV037]
MKIQELILSIVGAVAVIVGVKSHAATYIDRINPFVVQTVSYAKVEKGTQRYHNVEIIDPNTKKTRAYKLNNVGGYDPDEQYIKINHKGQYVKEIRYISKKEFEK